VNLQETSHALALVQAYDRRTVGEADVRAWHAVLSDAPAADVMEAIRRHYAEETGWIMPAHVRRLVRDIHAERQVLAGNPWAPGQHGVPRDQAQPEVSAWPAEVSGLPEPLRQLIRSVLPEGSREALMPRRVAWEREHRAYLRSHGGEPNPLYRPGTPCGVPSPHPRHSWQIEADKFMCPGIPGTADMDTGILPDAHRCAGCSFTTADPDRMDGHLRATGHQHEAEATHSGHYGVPFSACYIVGEMCTTHERHESRCRDQFFGPKQHSPDSGAPGMPDGAPERAREIAETMPTVGQWPGEHHSRDSVALQSTVTMCRNGSHEHFPGDPMLPSCALDG
jgi:hypothetical protein